MIVIRRDRQTRNILKNILAFKARIAGSKGKRVKLKKPPKQRPPLAQQREYYRLIKPIVEDLRKATEINFNSSFIQRLIQSSKNLRPDSFKKDTFIDEFGQVFGNMKVQFYQQWPDEKVQAIAQKAAKQTDLFSKNQFDKTMKQVIGIPVSAGDPWLDQEVKAFTLQNVGLIKSIPETYFQRLQETVIRGVTTGQLGDDIANDIQKISDVSDNKAKLIARDQTAKFNGTLTELRQKDVGVEKYTWSTSGDERVRPEHAARDGEVFAWSDPPEDGHPGIPINCRCVAIPFFEDPPEDNTDQTDQTDNPDSTDNSSDSFPG